MNKNRLLKMSALAFLFLLVIAATAAVLYFKNPVRSVEAVSSRIIHSPDSTVLSQGLCPGIGGGASTYTTCVVTTYCVLTGNEQGVAVVNPFYIDQFTDPDGMFILI